MGGAGVGVGLGVGFGVGETRGAPDGRGVPVVGALVAPPGCDVWRGEPAVFVGVGWLPADAVRRHLADGLVVLDGDAPLLDGRHVARVQVRVADAGRTRRRPP